MDSLPGGATGVDPFGSPDAAETLCRFRREVHACLPRRGDVLFEIADAMLCGEGPVRSPAELSLVPQHRRGHGGLYAGLNRGRIDVDRLRTVLAGPPVRHMDGRIVLGVDVSPWPRPGADTSPQRAFCHLHGRVDAHVVPGWPYSFVAALASGPTSWTAVLDAARLVPGRDATAATADQVRDVVGRLRETGQWHTGDPDVEVVVDAGFDVTRLAFLLADLPVVLTGRIRRNRSLLRPAPPQARGKWGRPPRHGLPMTLSDPSTWDDPDHVDVRPSPRYGTVRVRAWQRLHPRLVRRGHWADHPGGKLAELPTVEGTVICLEVDRLPHEGSPEPVWLWTSRPAATDSQVTGAWSAYLRRFDLEHTFRFLKQHLGWTRPKLRDPAAADRWTWLVVVAYTQLRLARPLADDLRRPWERPLTPDAVTPARVRRGFRFLHRNLAQPARAPKPSRPGPGRPPGVPNRHRAPRYPTGQTPSTG